MPRRRPLAAARKRGRGRPEGTGELVPAVRVKLCSSHRLIFPVCSAELKIGPKAITRVGIYGVGWFGKECGHAGDDPPEFFNNRGGCKEGEEAHGCLSAGRHGVRIVTQLVVVI